MAEWDAELTLDAAAVRSLLQGDFPRLRVRVLRPLATGWDNAVWLVNEELAFSFPRRAVAVPGIEREVLMLGALAPRLPLPIPVPAFVGRPSSAFPWPYFGARFLAGHEVAERPLLEVDAARAASSLAAFLRRLHHPALVDRFGARLPVDPNRRADMGYRAELTDARLSELSAIDGWTRPPIVDRLLGEASDLPPSAERAVTHGDLHMRHVLFDERGAISGVIDWGDMCLADPAIDLPLYWSLLPGAARRAFLDVYGDVPSASLLRARILAIFLCATLVVYGRRENLASLERAAREGLERSLS